MEKLMEHPATGGSYRRMPDGSLVPLEQPGMDDEEQAEAAKAAREQLQRDQAEIAATKAAEEKAAAEKAAEAPPAEGGTAQRKSRRE